MITAVELPLPLQDQLRDEALRAYPRECCGLLEGTVKLSAAHVGALHPMPNVAKDADRFEIDPSRHIALLRKLRGTGRTIIGCYHSHPNGRGEPSERDRACANEEGFLWLITAVDAETRAANTAAFICAVQRFSPVPIVDDIPETADATSPKAKTAAVSTPTVDRCGEWPI